MLYFDTLPKVITPDQNGNSIMLTNIMARATLLQEMQNNPMLFYKYSVQDGDTPEIVAEKYYGDPYKYWIVLYSNQLLDPAWAWPLKYEDFRSFINSKYGTEATAKTTVYAYEKIVTSVDGVTGKSTKTTQPVSLTAYNAIIPGSVTHTLPSGSSCTITTTKRTVDAYTYEEELNESKRDIKLMDSNYVTQLEQQFVALMKVK